MPDQALCARGKPDHINGLTYEFAKFANSGSNALIALTQTKADTSALLSFRDTYMAAVSD